MGFDFIIDYQQSVASLHTHITCYVGPSVYPYVHPIVKYIMFVNIEPRMPATKLVNNQIDSNYVFIMLLGDVFP